MDLANYTDWIALLLTLSIACLSIVLTVFMLPGAWVCIGSMFVIGVVWKPALITAPWWTFGVALFIALSGELLEFFAGAIGARRGGSSRFGAVAAIIGALSGALIAAPFLFPLGSVVGAIIFAGLFTLLVERFAYRRQWEESARAGTGAAIGRALATVAKTLCTVVIGIIFTIAVLND